MRLTSSREFSASVGNKIKTPTQRRLLEELEKFESESKGRQKKKVSKLVEKTGVHPPAFCRLPPVEPADHLYQRLIKEWGRFHNGGEVVWEMEAIPNSRLRVDACFPNYRLAIETDGWQFHGKYLNDFKRDRAKALKLVENGWSVIWVTKEMATTLLDDTIESISMALSHRPKVQAPEMVVLPGGWSRIVEG